MVEYVKEEDLTTSEAIQLAKDILFHNSNRIYALDLDLDSSEEPSLPVHTPALAVPPRTLPTQPQSPGIALSPSSTTYNVKLFREFQSQHPDLAFVYVQWLDYMGQMRTRMLPLKSFHKLLESDSSIGISRGNTGTLQDDSDTPAMTPIGQIYVRPVLESLRPTHERDMLRRPKTSGGKIRSSAMVMGIFCDEQRCVLPGDPRGRVAHMLNLLEQEHSLSFTLGFEVELVFLRRGDDSSWVPLTNSHSWSTLSDEQYHNLDLLTECVDALADCGIDVQQFHAESAPGQYEFILEPIPALAAIDTLVQARKVIQQVASLRDLRATLHPQPFKGIGTAAHIHFSASRAAPAIASGQQQKAVEQQMAHFVAGVLTHLPAICAYTLPSSISYTRVAPSAWMGGVWMSWGTQNRECPLRRIDDKHWELRCIDGLANPYFAVASLLAAGLVGLRDEADLGKWKDCQVDLARVNDDERRKLGVEEMLPSDLGKSLQALGTDEALRKVLGDVVVDDYVVMKEKETALLEAMEEGKRRDWIIERY